MKHFYRYMPGLFKLTIFFIAASALSLTARAQGTPGTPSVSGNFTICSGSTATFTASGASGASFGWYDAATGGTLLSTSATYTTPVLTASKNYYVQQTVSGSTSSRLAVTVVVAAAPSLTTPTNLLATPATICQGTFSALTANVDATAGQYVYWYDAATGGNLLAGVPSGGKFNVSPNATTTYYAQSQAKIDTATFNYTGSVQTFTVPAGVTSLQIDASGGRGGKGTDLGGGSKAGGGGRVQATMAVTPGQVLSVYVGGAGADFHSGSSSPGGFNGGGNGPVCFNSGPGGGGGATDIRTNGQALSNRVLVAGGGGGGTGSYPNFTGGSGSGGGLTGNTGPLYSNGQPAGGGSQTAGGAGGCDANGCAPAGSRGQGGDGQSDGGKGGGGGGGGFYGGGGGGSVGGGGGGSSYTDSTFFQNVVHTQGYQGGNGQLIITYNSSANCAVVTRQPLTVTVNTTPQVSAGVNVITCAGTAVTLTATGANTYVWQPGNLTGASVTVSPLVTTTYTVTGTLTNGGCSNSSTVTVTVTSISVSASQTTCAGQTVTLHASGADSYTWMPGNLTGASIDVSPTATTVYTVTGHNNNAGCNSTAQTTVTVNPLPVISAGGPITVTAGTSVTLTASGNSDNYQWSVPYSLNSPSITFIPSATQTWTVTGTITSTGCSATTTVLVTVVPAPSVTGNTIVCPGSTTMLTASGTGPFTWYDAITGGNLLFTGAAFTTPAINSNITYWVSDNGGTRIPVNINAPKFMSKAVATPASICAGSSSALSVTQNNQTINWYDAATGGNLLGSTPAGGSISVSPAQTTVYYARITAPVQPDTVIFNYTGGVQNFTIPAGVTSMQIDADGGGGGRGGISGGRSGRVQATMSVIPGQVLSIYVGGAGSDFQASRNNNPILGGYNGGGNAPYRGTNGAGAGGGATDIRINGQALSSRVLVAGGGGGGYEYFANLSGSAGGGLTGQNGEYDVTYYGNAAGGGSQTAGGARSCDASSCAQSGSLGQGGQGLSNSGTVGGGGGGGFYGGGGGNTSGGGGGGSSYTNAAIFQNVVHTQGYQAGNGYLKIIYNAVSSCAVSMVLPDTVTVTPLLTPSVKIAAAANCQACMPQTVTFTATATNGGTAPVYAWYKNGGVVGTNSPSYSDNALTATDQVWCIFTSNYPCLTTNAISSNKITTATPVISAISPSSGPVGSLVTLTGSNFLTLSTVSIGGVPAIPVSNTDTQILAMVMPGASTGNVTVNTIFGSTTGAGNFTVTPTLPPVMQQGGKIVATSGVTATSQVGHAVAISADGNTAVASLNSSPGGVIVFTRQSGAWTQQAMLSGTGGIGTALQGSAVAISADGNTVIFSAQTDAGGKGAFWAFTRNNGVWSQQGNKLSSSDAAAGSPGSYFGSALSLSANGNTALIGGTYDNLSQGAAWIFKRDDAGAWTQNGNKLTGTRATGNSYFGNAVALSADGNTALVGGFFDASRTGAVWAFVNNNGSWAQQGGKLTGSGATGGLGEFGNALSLSADGNTALIGGYHDNSSAGAAWIFTRNNAVWAQQGNKLTATGAIGSFLSFGQSVGLSADGNIAMVGAPNDNKNMGAMWVFRRNNGAWAVYGSKLVGGGLILTDFQPGMGQSVTISADASTAFAGDQNDNANAGAAWAYIPLPPVPLTSLTVSTGTLSPAFSPGVNNYTVTVNGAIQNITVTPSVSDPAATITVNGASTPSGSASAPISLTVGVNNIAVVVTASDGITTDSYSVAVTRFSTDATLAGLSLSSGVLNPVFSSANTAYTASVSNATSSVTITPVTNDAGATVKVNGVTVASGSPSAALPLIVGANVISTVVTAQDGVNTKTYTVTVVRLSNNALLTSIKINPSTALTLVSGADYKDYTTTVPNSETSVKITPTAQDATASIKVNGVATAGGAASAAIPLSVGDNVINTVVTAQDGTTTKTYSIKFTRLPSTNANLAGFTISSGTLTPVFAAGTTGYTATVNTATITVTPTTGDATATVKVNGTTLASGTASGAIALNAGANVINIVVTAQDGVTTQTYRLTVTNGSNNALLTTLKVSPSTALTLVSGGDYKDYTTAVPNTETSVKITPTAQDATASIKVNGVVTASGTASAAVPLHAGGNVINTVVTAQDGITTKTYSIKFTRLPTTNANLAGLKISSGTLTPVFAAGAISYTATVNTATIAVTPTASDADATIKVNGTTVASGTASTALPLVVGLNTITTVVTASDGTTTKIYTLTVTRLSNNALLTTLKVNPVTTLTVVSGPDYKDYTTTVPNTETGVKITPTVQDATATIKVNGVSVSSGAASASIPLNVGDNIINTVVIAQDGITTKTYSIKFTRLPPGGTSSLYTTNSNRVDNNLLVHQNVSPNGDGNSDVLIIDGITAYPENKLRIMSRSGILVYEVKGYNNDTNVFDGHASSNGKLQQAGTYFYSLEYKDGNETKYKTGFIVLKY
ncbi:cadherin-like beta sandwich domain-containing protein [Mucilaginibacter sp.]|uniref:cadherin-like beta sandwich domain-containing protein n=1 Tax=Mucilaginibacter sp. TaxID=1882438 RepID=UPI0025EF5429|nr:cadherin-like beta sandwich domain-containing protein [Mucilaginibacter sp.]